MARENSHAQSFAGKERSLRETKCFLALPFLEHAVDAVDGQPAVPYSLPLRQHQREQEGNPEPVLFGHDKEIEVVQRLGPLVCGRAGDRDEAHPGRHRDEASAETSCQTDALDRQLGPICLLPSKPFRPYEGNRALVHDQPLRQLGVTADKFFEFSRRGE